MDDIAHLLEGAVVIFLGLACMAWIADRMEENYRKKHETGASIYRDRRW